MYLEIERKMRPNIKLKQGASLDLEDRDPEDAERAWRTCVEQVSMAELSSTLLD